MPIQGNFFAFYDTHSPQHGKGILVIGKDHATEEDYQVLFPHLPIGSVLRVQPIGQFESTYQKTESGFVRLHS